jgi:CheY-like chemotaxis protein
VEPLNVLVIEDDCDVLDLLDGHLTRLGCRVSRAHDGETGVELARRTVPDVVFVDVMLPGIDGQEVGRQLRRDARTAGCRIVGTSVLDVQDIEGPEFDAVLAKPFRRADVQTALVGPA